MGGTLPICPFCKKQFSCGMSVKQHIKAKHIDKYKQWIKDGGMPYWMYNEFGELRKLIR